MKVTPSPLVSKLSGSVGHITFLDSRHGTLAKIKSMPRQSNIMSSKSVQQRYSKLCETWRSLTGAQRLNWADMAPSYTLYDRFEQPYKPSAFQLFLYKNLIVWPVSQNIITTCVAYSQLPEPGISSSSIFLSTSKFEIEFTKPFPSSRFIKLWFSNYYPHSYLGLYPPVFYFSNLVTTDPSPFNFFSYLQLILGSAPVSGYMVFLHSMFVDKITGLVGPLQGETVSIVP